jgi:hypothetical protein
VNVALPAVSGTPLPGQTLACSTGTWTGNPAAFTYSYSWNRNGARVASGSTYVVGILDEAATLSCTVTASNAAGTGAPATSNGALVAVSGTLRCPRPAGALSATRIGPLRLAETRAQARRSLSRYAVTHYGFDDFCLYAGWGIRGAYKAGRLVLMLTANPFYKLQGVTVGITIASVAARLHVGRGFVIGLNDWYLAPGRTSNYVFKVRHGVIQEIGIANKQDTGTTARQKAFLSGFRAV